MNDILYTKFGIHINSSIFLYIYDIDLCKFEMFLS
jgi:hypothetical protein